MAGTIQCVQGIERVTIFGVRHLSPAASFHLLALLARVQPKCVLIEGPSDADDLLGHLADARVQPPVALLAYTADLPVDTVLFPLADYSPEFQAIRWAQAQGKVVRFIDLPSGVAMKLKAPPTGEATEEEREEEKAYRAWVQELYNTIASIDRVVDFNDYFEKNFEHNLHCDVYNRALTLETDEMRQLTEPLEAAAYPHHHARNLVREAYMAAQIQRAINEGYAPEDIVVVTGAYHAARLRHTVPLDNAVILPKRKTKLTLMPYSFLRLSNQAGYGAGNRAPAYFQLMWECMNGAGLENLPARYMAQLGSTLRTSGGYCATSNVIEAVRLARGLAYIKEASMPTLADLHDAAIACIGGGDAANLADAFARVDVGTAFGALPHGISQTPVQDDFYRELKRLKLEKYKSTVSAELTLDLRENIRVKSEEAAFIDLHRSTFLHRLAFLGIQYARISRNNQDGATWREVWTLQWTPEAEIQVVEAVLKGETIELAAAFTLKEKLDACEDVAQAAQLVTTACVCQLLTGVENARATLQRLAADAHDFIKTADAAYSLAQLVQFGDLRKFDTAPLLPLLQQLFLRAALLLTDYASCDDNAAKEAVSAINALHYISQENHALVDDAAWVQELTALAGRDDKNAKLSGLAFSLLLERNIISEDFCAKEVARRLSPGIPAELGAGWFEGLSMRNRYALLSRTHLWQELDAYIQQLDDDAFKRSVVYMRRAFDSFEPREKNSVAELLGELWATDAGEVSLVLQAPLDEEEVEALQALDDFEFDF